MAFSSSSARRQTTTGDADPPGPRPPPPHIRASYVLAMTDTRKCVCIELGLLWAGFTLFFPPDVAAVRVAASGNFHGQKRGGK